MTPETLYNIYLVLQPFYYIILGAFTTTIFLVAYFYIDAYYPKPPEQFIRAVKTVSVMNKVDKKLDRKADKEQIAEDISNFKKEYVENAYKRLGYAGSYLTYLNDLDKQVKQIRLLSLVFLVAGFLILTVEYTLGFIIIMVGLIFLLMTKKFADGMAMSSLRSRISHLNRYQRLEIDLLIDRFMAIIPEATTNQLSSVISKYLNVSTALKQDLKVLQADCNLRTIQEALDLWRDRITIGNNSYEMQEISSFIEKLKKMYIQGDTYGLHTEMFQINNMIIEKYFNTYLEKESSRRTKRIIKILIVLTIIMFFIILLPHALEVAMSMSSVKSM